MLPESEIVNNGDSGGILFLTGGSDCMLMVTRKQLELLRKRNAVRIKRESVLRG